MCVYACVCVCQCVYLQYLVAAIFEETYKENSHDYDDGDEDSCVDQGKAKRLDTTGGGALVEWKIVAENNRQTGQGRGKVR